MSPQVRIRVLRECGLNDRMTHLLAHPSHYYDQSHTLEVSAQGSIDGFSLITVIQHQSTAPSCSAPGDQARTSRMYNSEPQLDEIVIDSEDVDDADWTHNDLLPDLMRHYGRERHASEEGEILLLSSLIIFM